ncbi:MAG: imidazole glycerol phosphate synthase subunit HisH [Clostridia bacterium]|nr:imidazole glycerol phosphate synthase subunit HisH [Clostridia bacterium]
MIAIVDYGAGNLANVSRALEFLGAQAVVTSDAGVIREAERVLLPGVGAFGDAMESLRRKGLEQVLCQAAEEKPFLGICLGLQLLFEESEESPGVSGLGVLKGSVRRFRLEGLKVPHMGWNTLQVLQKEGVFAHLEEQKSVYFVHSYYVCPEEPVAATRTEYGIPFVSAVQKGQLAAMQFHPEKSGTVGLGLLKAFIDGREA